jgi:uracil-DNA glycosylase family 4
MKLLIPDSAIGIAKEKSLFTDCSRCKLKQTCDNALLQPVGKGKKNILIIYATPTRSECFTNKPVTDDSWLQLEDVLDECGVDMMKDCWLLPAIACHTKYPKNNHALACQANVEKHVANLKPKKIIMLGHLAVSSVVSSLWKSDIGTTEKWAGQRIPAPTLGCFLYPTYELSTLEDKKIQQAAMLHIRKHVKAALADDRDVHSFPTLETLKENVKIITDTKEVIKAVEKIITTSPYAAIDYETNCLKPETAGASIVCTAITDGAKSAIVFPFTRGTIHPLLDFWTSRIGKIAANFKFEWRWTNQLLRTRPRNFIADTTLLAHVENSTPGTKSLKFQAFVKYGILDYNSHIEPYFELEQDGLNRIRDLDIFDVMLYCGIDALIEAYIYEKEFKRLK